MQIAVAVFDHCSVQFFELNKSGETMTITKLDKQMQNIHKIPVKSIRLSKKQPNLMVSCGDESDLFIKLWNVAAGNTSDPVNSIQTNQIRHKYLV